MNILLLPSPAGDAVVKYLINRSISIGADGIPNISRLHLCSDIGSSALINESFAETASDFICGLQCPGEFQ